MISAGILCIQKLITIFYQIWDGFLETLYVLLVLGKLHFTNNKILRASYVQRFQPFFEEVRNQTLANNILLIDTWRLGGDIPAQK